MAKDMKTEMLDMYGYYIRQPAFWRQMVTDRFGYIDNFVNFYGEKRPDRIYLVGSGSSLNACKAAKDYIERLLRVEVSFFAPSLPLPPRGERPMILAVSQGGRSTNTLSCLRSFRAKGLPVAVFTAEPNDLLREAADLVVDIGVGPETAGPKTLGYSATVLCLYLAALEGARKIGLISETYQSELSVLEETVNAGEENQKACEAFYREHLETLKSARQYLFAGKGPAAAAAEESALKVLETLCFPAAGYEFEEFLHGPACGINHETALFLFLPDDADAPRMRKLGEIASKVTENVYIISRFSSESIDGKVLHLRSGKSPSMSPFTDIFIGQLLSSRLTLELGRERHPALREIFSDMDTKVQDSSGAGQS